MEKNMKALKRVKIGVAIAAAIVWTVVGILGIKAMVDINSQEKEQQEAIRVEREYLVDEYTQLKQGVAKDIVKIMELLQKNPTLTFSRSDKDELMKSYKNIVNTVGSNKAIDKVTVADEYNLDIYTAVIIMNEDLKGFSSNFAIAIDSRNYNALDNSLKYLMNTVELMNNTDKHIKDLF